MSASRELNSLALKIIEKQYLPLLHEIEQLHGKGEKEKLEEKLAESENIMMDTLLEFQEQKIFDRVPHVLASQLTAFKVLNADHKLNKEEAGFHLKRITHASTERSMRALLPSVDRSIVFRPSLVNSLSGPIIRRSFSRDHKRGQPKKTIFSKKTPVTYALYPDNIQLFEYIPGVVIIIDMRLCWTKKDYWFDSNKVTNNKWHLFGAVGHDEVMKYRQYYAATTLEAIKKEQKNDFEAKSRRQSRQNEILPGIPLIAVVGILGITREKVFQDQVETVVSTCLLADKINAIYFNYLHRELAYQRYKNLFNLWQDFPTYIMNPADGMVKYNVQEQLTDIHVALENKKDKPHSYNAAQKILTEIDHSICSPAIKIYLSVTHRVNPPLLLSKEEFLKVTSEEYNKILEILKTYNPLSVGRTGNVDEDQKIIKKNIDLLFRYIKKADIIQLLSYTGKEFLNTLAETQALFSEFQEFFSPVELLPLLSISCPISDAIFNESKVISTEERALTIMPMLEKLSLVKGIGVPHIYHFLTQRPFYANGAKTNLLAYLLGKPHNEKIIANIISKVTPENLMDFLKSSHGPIYPSYLQLILEKLPWDAHEIFSHFQGRTPFSPDFNEEEFCQTTQLLQDKGLDYNQLGSLMREVKIVDRERLHFIVSVLKKMSGLNSLPTNRVISCVGNLFSDDWTTTNTPNCLLNLEKNIDLLLNYLNKKQIIRLIAKGEMKSFDTPEKIRAFLNVLQDKRFNFKPLELLPLFSNGYVSQAIFNEEKVIGVTSEKIKIIMPVLRAASAAKLSKLSLRRVEKLMQKNFFDDEGMRTSLLGYFLAKVPDNVIIKLISKLSLNSLQSILLLSRTIYPDYLQCVLEKLRWSVDEIFNHFQHRSPFSPHFNEKELRQAIKILQDKGLSASQLGILLNAAKIPDRKSMSFILPILEEAGFSPLQCLRTIYFEVRDANIIKLNIGEKKLIPLLEKVDFSDSSCPDTQLIYDEVVVVCLQDMEAPKRFGAIARISDLNKRVELARIYNPFSYCGSGFNEISQVIANLLQIGLQAEQVADFIKVSKIISRTPLKDREEISFVFLKKGLVSKAFNILPPATLIPRLFDKHLDEKEADRNKRVNETLKTIWDAKLVTFERMDVAEAIVDGLLKSTVTLNMVDYIAGIIKHLSASSTIKLIIASENPLGRLGWNCSQEDAFISLLKKQADDFKMSYLVEKALDNIVLESIILKRSRSIFGFILDEIEKMAKSQPVKGSDKLLGFMRSHVINRSLLTPEEKDLKKKKIWIALDKGLQQRIKQQIVSSSLYSMFYDSLSDEDCFDVFANNLTGLKLLKFIYPRSDSGRGDEFFINAFKYYYEGTPQHLTIDDLCENQQCAFSLMNASFSKGLFKLLKDEDFKKYFSDNFQMAENEWRDRPFTYNFPEHHPMEGNIVKILDLLESLNNTKKNIVMRELFDQFSCDWIRAFFPSQQYNGASELSRVSQLFYRGTASLEDPSQRDYLKALDYYIQYQAGSNLNRVIYAHLARAAVICLTSSYARNDKLDEIIRDVEFDHKMGTQYHLVTNSRLAGICKNTINGNRINFLKKLLLITLAVVSVGLLSTGILALAGAPLLAFTAAIGVPLVASGSGGLTVPFLYIGFRKLCHFFKCRRLLLVSNPISQSRCQRDDKPLFSTRSRPSNDYLKFAAPRLTGEDKRQDSTLTTLPSRSFPTVSKGRNHSFFTPFTPAWNHQVNCRSTVAKKRV